MLRLQERWKILASVGVVFLLLTFLPSVAIAGRKKEELKKAPPLPVNGLWLNGTPGNKAFSGRLTLLYFWDYTSIHCLRELQYLKGWYDLYHPYGLEMIFIHAPEFQFATDETNVQRALERLDIPYPVYLDNEFKVWEDYGVIAWPTKVLVNAKARILHKQVGEGYYASLEQKIREVLLEINPAAVLPSPLVMQDFEFYNSEVCGEMSAETTLGYKQPNWWGGEMANGVEPLPDKVYDYRDYGTRLDQGFFVHGRWRNGPESFELARNPKGLTDYLGILYTAHEVYAVINPMDWQEALATTGGKVMRVYVTRDGAALPPDLRGPDIREDAEGRTYFLLDEPRLYYLVTRDDNQYHELKLWPQQKGIAINAFSFSNRCLSDFEHL